MNIFYLDSDPTVCAQWHVDKHAVKMVLEYAQLLSTAHRVLDGIEEDVAYIPVKFEYYDNHNLKGMKVGKPKVRKDLTLYHDDIMMERFLYRQTHTNHPSAIWVRQSAANYRWLFKLFTELLWEYEHRYGKKHKCWELHAHLERLPHAIEDDVTAFTEPTPAMPEEYRIEGDSITSYHRYYNGEKNAMFAWKNRGVPPFIQTQL